MNVFNLINLITWVCLILLGINVKITRSQQMRIAGGTIARKGQFPFFAQLKLTYPRKVLERNCGASLISRRWLLSAAHCFEDFRKFSLHELARRNRFKVYMGTNIRFDEKASINFIKKVYIHPKYFMSIVNGSHTEIQYDVAVLLLKKSYKLSELIQIIPLAVPIENYNAWIITKMGITMGTGLIRVSVENSTDLFSKHVMYTRQRLVSVDHLLNLGLGEIFLDITMIESNEVFALTPIMKGHPMIGDFGGPLFIYLLEKPALYGILSFNRKMKKRPNIEGPQMISAYERVDKHLEFIYDTIHKLHKQNKLN